MSDADILTEVIFDSIEDQDGDVIEDLDFSPTLTLCPRVMLKNI